MKKLHPLIPTDLVNNLEFLLNELKTDLGYQKFDNITSPKIYQTFNLLFFFSLGAQINKFDPLKSNPYHIDLAYKLNKDGFIDAKPQNLEELQNTYMKMFERTSEYLKELD